MTSFARDVPPAVADRLPPGQVLTEKFPVLQFGQVPSYPDLSGWDLRVWGAVEQPITLKWAEVRALPVREVTLDIHCVTRWSKLDTAWEGAQIAHLAETAAVQPEASHVIFHSEYGYTANVPLEIALQPDALVAWSYDGKPLEPEHGYPLRALVPGRYFWKSAKWLRGIEFSIDDRPGFWERNGYNNNADPWREERYSDD
ncbi:MAG TPA: sulfite oxidase-like oxidoreductase [Candidatus Limnocylindria bacterium]|nr:sulfite oxidase-like oxidoreductase [Candidatus Limnocylindria bacterium]